MLYFKIFFNNTAISKKIQIFFIFLQYPYFLYNTLETYSALQALCKNFLLFFCFLKHKVHIPILYGLHYSIKHEKTTLLRKHYEQKKNNHFFTRN